MAAELRERLVQIRVVLFCRFPRPLTPYSCGQRHNRAGCLRTSETRQPLAFRGFLQTLVRGFCFDIHRCPSVTRESRDATRLVAKLAYSRMKGN